MRTTTGDLGGISSVPDVSAKYAVKAYFNIRMPARDGVELSTHIFLPSTGGPFPVVATRTPYDASGSGGALDWAARGYAYVKQDTRGKFLSDGEWYPWHNEINDGEDMLDWIAAQPWCNGNIAMYGGSYVATTQLAASFSGHPALKCITPCLVGAAFYHKCYWGGALRLAWQTCWTLAPKTISDQNLIRNHLPLMDMDEYSGGKQIRFWREELAHPQFDEYWHSTSVPMRAASIKAPAFIRTGWHDLFIADAWDLFGSLRARGGSETVRNHTRILVGPWPHNVNQRLVGEEDFGDESVIADLMDQEMAFMDHFTANKSGYDVSVAPLRLFIMGANTWRDEYEWPLARTVWTDFYLSSEGRANTSSGDGRLDSAPSGVNDTFDYDPADPVPTTGGAWDFTNCGPRDQTAVEARADVLVYTSEELREDMEVTGPVEVKLFASSSAKDTDFTAKLVDLRLDGRAMSVTDGIIRARHRNATGEPKLLVPGEICEFTIRCNPTAYVFKKGHKLRLEISSSNFPVFDRNLNTGNDPARDTEMQIAHQTIYHTPGYPSRIILPVIGAKR